MKRCRITTAVLIGLTAGSFAVEPERAFALPDALKFSTPEVPADQNNLPRFFAAFPRSDRTIVVPIAKAQERLDAGKDAGNPHLLEKLRERHQLAKNLLKPPLEFPPDNETDDNLSLVSLFMGARVLARQAFFEKDYSVADDLIGDMLEWSRLLRNARPNLIQSAMSRSGWKNAFNTLLVDWENHPDQTKRLTAIELLLESNRIERGELMEALKSEARWSARTGGLRNILKDERYADSAAMFLKPPFNKLSAEDLLKLPYDAEADFRRDMNETLGTLERLKEGTPLIHWPGFEIPITGHALEDYAKRPNGLGDLYREQMEPSLRQGTWSGVLSLGPLMDACLHWLKLERDGKSINENSFANWPDPIDGKPMAIDVKQRTIRSRGPNQKADPPDPQLGPLPAAGFTLAGDDTIIVVPRWRTAAIVDGAGLK